MDFLGGGVPGGWRWGHLFCDSVGRWRGREGEVGKKGGRGREEGRDDWRYWLRYGPEGIRLIWRFETIGSEG